MAGVALSNAHAPRAVGPVAPRERIGSLDALRGVAVAGILTANIGAFSGWMFMSTAQQALVPRPAANGIADFLLRFLVEGKFYSIFSLLFGIGFALWLERGPAALPRFRRRLAGLLVIGLLHHLCWPGDILTLYALMGFALIPLAGLEDRRLIQLAGFLLVLPVALDAIAVASGGRLDLANPVWMVASATSRELFGRSLLDPLPLYQDGSWLDVLKANILGFTWRWGALLAEGRPFKVLAMFLLGAWAGRTGVFRNPGAHRVLLERTRAWGLGLGLPLNLAWAAWAGYATGWTGVARAGLQAVAVAPLALGYASAVLLAWHAGRTAWLRAFCPLGRMALSNYLAQTAIGIALFYGVGLGWMGTMGPAVTTLLCVPIIAVQMLVSTLWLRRFAQGPAEWLWRRATYGTAGG